MKRALSARAIVAFVTLTATRYTAAHCTCGAPIMMVPGQPVVEVRIFTKEPSGRGRTLVCPRCKSNCEVIEHAAT